MPYFFRKVIYTMILKNDTIIPFCRFVYSVLYSCFLGYVREFLLLFLHLFPFNLIILKVDFACFLSLRFKEI